MQLSPNQPKTEERDSYEVLQGIMDDVKRFDCRMPVEVKDEDRNTIGTIPCRSPYIHTCPSCALRRRADLRTIALDGVINVDPECFIFVTLVPPGFETDEELVAWNDRLVRYFENFIAGVRRRIGYVDYWKGVEFQRRGAGHIHALLRFDQPLTKEEIEELWQIIYTTRVRTVLGRSIGCGLPGGSNKARHEMIKPCTSEKSVRKALGYILKSCHLRASDQIPWNRFVELEDTSLRVLPTRRSRNNGAGAGYRGHLTTRSRGWTDLTLRAIRRMRSKAQLPNLRKTLAGAYFETRVAFGPEVVEVLASRLAVAQIQHIHSLRAQQEPDSG